MKFSLDTEICGDINLQLDTDADLQKTIADFAFGLSAFYADFAMQLSLNEEQTMSLLEVVQSCITTNVDAFISEGLLNPDNVCG